MDMCALQQTVRGREADTDQMADFTIYGPTCDNTDQLPLPVRLPADMREGDWIEFGQIGAYSNALSSKFNGFYPDTYVQVDDDAMAVE